MNQKEKNLERFETLHKPQLLEKIKNWNKKSWKVISDSNNNLPVLDEIPGWSYFHGSVGNGKTTRALWQLLEWCRLRYLNGKFVIDCDFVTAKKLLDNIRMTFREEANAEYELIRHYETVNLLVVDDIGGVNSTEWGYSTLLRIIDTRESMERTTILTSNFDLKQLSLQLKDDRIPDRIRGACQNSIYHFTGKSKR